MLFKTLASYKRGHGNKSNIQVESLTNHKEPTAEGAHKNFSTTKGQVLLHGLLLSPLNNRVTPPPPSSKVHARFITHKVTTLPSTHVHTTLSTKVGLFKKWYGAWEIKLVVGVHLYGTCPKAKSWGGPCVCVCVCVCVNQQVSRGC